MRRLIAASALLFVLIASASAPAAAEPAAPARTQAWSEATEISSGWETRPDINADGTAVVALNNHPDQADGHKQIVYFARSAAGWSGPQVLASNGVAQETGMLPQYTHPLLSGAGRTVAYLGATGQSAPAAQYAVYVLDREEAGWTAPYELPTGLLNPHYHLALSADGNAVVYHSYLFGDPVWPLYVMNRVIGGWGAPVQLSNAWGGGSPTMSADGTAVAYGATNSRLMFVEKIGDDWLAPVLLVDNNPDQFVLENPTLSADGRALFFWKVKLTPAGGFYVRTEQDLYVVRRQGTGWTAAMKITATPVIPSTPIDAPAATDAHGTRVIYSRPRRENDTIIGAVLEMTEFIGGAWTAPTAVTDFKYYASDKYPQLSWDGKRLIYQADHYLYDGTHGLRERTTAAAPTLLPQPAVVTGTLGAGAATFVAGATALTFPTNTFTSTVMFTYTQLATLAAQSAGALVPVGYEFELSAVYSDTLQAAAIAPGAGYQVAIDYDALRPGAISPTTLQLYRWTGVDWTQEGIMPGVEVTGTRLIARVDRLGRFAVFGRMKMRVFLPVIVR